jgi:hypothetical protein
MPEADEVARREQLKRILAAEPLLLLKFLLYAVQY